MSENNNIKLDPDVLNQQQNTKVPLSDLYGIPVFSPETDRMAEKVKANETDAVTQIEQQIFGESFGRKSRNSKNSQSTISDADRINKGNCRKQKTNRFKSHPLFGSRNYVFSIYGGVAFLSKK